MPEESIVPLAQARDAILLCSRFRPFFAYQTHVSELAWAHALAERGRAFAVTDDPAALFEKAVVWFIPMGTKHGLVEPTLWDYSRQVVEFARGLERQGNSPLCSAEEVAFWENKAHMHARLSEIGAPTPRTTVLTAESWRSAEFDLEPVLIKEEHSAGSAGIHHFETASAAREFVAGYWFKPNESLIMQELVRATRDLRLTMAGGEMVSSATYWRTKTAEAMASPSFITTATSFGSAVKHGDIPETVVPFAARCLRRLGIRTAGIDLIWVDDDTSGDPLILELSPYYQPNPPKPEHYAGWTYNEYKERRRVLEDGYIVGQYRAFREAAERILDRDLL